VEDICSRLAFPFLPRKRTSSACGGLASVGKLEECQCRICCRVVRFGTLLGGAAI
jgi:hypothetical protein